ncbi:hypothetical protein I312_104587 [Cryptococcus bacillisporus CA1280]|uniref:Uncharacterized protein n=2 Tax=Cryptococcus gattii TaxID=552467 RepID=A0A0D0VMB4_CRYGA|nr:hypothetical protein I312_04653 [Cryptococcus bacillisporus CA1280]KIR58862.1 hypothetical protein I314_05275 [Cryptococcus bacillisporus CA1873]|eukprot:KIR58862.1 hypothetical protein I314_05275 [Cryptococcus gattii CA1873]
MEFLASSQEIDKPKQLYPCLAVVDINASSDKSRRLSAGSFGSDKDEGNVLTRVISGGGRRKSSFGETGGGGGGRRLSFGGRKDDDKVEGKWYWRVQVGVNDTHLVLLPLTQPPNPLLTTRPAPLSTAIPSHSTRETSTHHDESAIAEHEGGGSEPGFASRVKNIFRRASSSLKERPSAPSASETTSGGTNIAGERLTDQTERGEMLPSAGGNAEGATNLNSNAEMGWPGIINNEKLAAILIPLSSIGKKVGLGGGKKAEGSWVSVQVTSSAQAMEPIGVNKFEPTPKSGFVKFEFDKDWLGAKGEAEVLHHYITTAAASAPPPAERTAPNPSAFQLGGQQATSGAYQQTQQSDPLFSGTPFGNTGGAGQYVDRPLVDEAIAPDVNATSSRKVAGVY